MWIRISSVLLATLVVSGLSLPRPDEKEYKIPQVGAGSRSQYYVLHSDGTFKYGFDTGEGAFESVKSHTLGNRGGKFGYVDPDGKTIRLEYEAGEGGFVARGDHLPKPSTELAQALAAVVRSNRSFVDHLAGVDSDASYGFRFKSDDHSRNEQADSDGTVTGSYSYVDENGVTRSFTYRAGKGIGFVIEGDGITQPIHTQAGSVKPTQRRTSSLHQTYVRRQQGPTASTRKAHTPRTFGVPLRKTSFTGQQANIASTRSQTPGDASYSFSYNAGDHSRSEASDRDLNVDGTFSFVADDGNKRTLNYVAGSATGFKAEGDHLPKAPVADFGSRISLKSAHRSHNVGSVRTPTAGHQSKVRASHRQGSTFKTTGAQRVGATFRQGTSSTSTGSQLSSTRATHGQRTGFKPTNVGARHRQAANGHSSFQSSILQPSHKQTAFTSGVVGSGFQRNSPLRTFEEANIRSSVTPSGPYSFSYDTSSHSRSESGDDDNDVVGNFAFVSEDDGQRREVNYQAGSSTGFIAEGVHLPVGPEVPGAPSGQPTGRLVRVSTAPFIDPLADSDTDASYSFGFESDTYSRSESADEDGNIVGTYTIVEEDGTRITYRFKAGKGIGFETEEISRSKGPRPVHPVPYSGPLAGSTVSHGASFASAQRGQAQTKVHGTSLTGTSAVHRTTSAFGAAHRGLSHSTNKHGATSFHGTASTGSIKTPVVRKHFPSTKSSFKRTHHFTNTGTKSSFTPSAILKSSLTPTHSHSVFPGFTLHSYDPSESAEKFGYVLKFDD